MSTERKNVTPFELHRDNAPAYSEVDILWLLLADGAQTGGAFSQHGAAMPEGFGSSSSHAHTD